MQSPVNGPGVHAEQHGKSLHGRHPEGKRDEQGYAHRRRQARHGPEQDAQRNPGDVGYQRTETQGRFYPSKNLGHRVLLRQHDLKEVSEGIQQRSRGQRRHSYDFNGIPASQKGQGEQQEQERGDQEAIQHLIIDRINDCVQEILEDVTLKDLVDAYEGYQDSVEGMYYI